MIISIEYKLYYHLLLSLLVFTDTIKVKKGRQWCLHPAPDGMVLASWLPWLIAWALVVEALRLRGSTACGCPGAVWAAGRSCQFCQPLAGHS
jgi:hypothetical protein